MTALGSRVVAAAEAAMGASRSVSALDVLGALGWLTQNHLDHWRQGRTPHLEPLLQMRADNLAKAVEALQAWASDRGLVPHEVAYVGSTRDRKPLHCIPDGTLDALLRTQWTAQDLSNAQRERLVERQERPPDLVVVEPVREWTCTGCGGTGGLLTMEDAGPLCLTCADLDTLVFLPAGDATVTRRAKKASGLSAVVVRWDGRRYRRLGILVEEPALRAAEESCLADADARLRQRERDRVRREGQDVRLAEQMAALIVRLFPGCPPGRAEAIAAHTSVRGSGRVGRSAAGRALAEEPVTRAVVASVRHQDTAYDALLMAGVPRDEARERIHDDVGRVLDGWRSTV
jgi:hypothetical protein